MQKCRPEIIRGWINLLGLNLVKPCNDILIIAYFFSTCPRRNLVDIFVLSHDRWRLGYLGVKSLPLWWRKNFDHYGWIQLSSGGYNLRITVYGRRASDFFYIKSKLHPIYCRLEFHVQYSLNVVSILIKKGNGKMQPCNVVSNKVGV